MAPQVAVGAIVVKDERLLMIRRNKDPGAGLWSLPGGRVEHGEYLADALRREVAEETGLEVEVHDLVGILEVVPSVPAPDSHYVILDYYAEVTGDDSPVAAGDVSDARWVPLDEVASLPCTPRFEETLRGWGVLPR